MASLLEGALTRGVAEIREETKAANSPGPNAPTMATSPHQIKMMPRSGFNCLSLSIAGVMLGFLLTPQGARAQSLPFKPSPQGYASYLNDVQWSSGSKIVFTGLNSCQDTGPRYRCLDGKATITSPSGQVKVCTLALVAYTKATDSPTYAVRSCTTR